MNASGGVPDTNPFGNLVWAYGIRNSYGFAFDPETNRLWASENGPSCNDELNRIVKGANHGWGPSQTCVSPPAPPVNTNQDGPSPVLPKRFYTPTTAPTGVAFCSGCGLGAGKEGHLFYGTYKTGQIREVTLNTSRFGVAAEALAYSHSSGVLSVESAPDGRVYFSDGSGIYRLSLT
jgi:glucose/arabinose dehydrogenase